MTDSDSQLDETRPTIPLLLSILRFEVCAFGAYQAITDEC